MKYEVEVQTTRSERRTVEAASLDEALELAKAGKGVSMNEGQISVTTHGRPSRDFSGLDTAMLATGIRSVSEEA